MGSAYSNNPQPLNSWYYICGIYDGSEVGNNIIKCTHQYEGIICNVPISTYVSPFEDTRTVSIDDNLPIHICYFDGINTNIDRDLEIFIELTRSYQRRKRHQRVYPDYFE